MAFLLAGVSWVGMASCPECKKMCEEPKPKTELVRKGDNENEKNKRE